MIALPAQTPWHNEKMKPMTQASKQVEELSKEIANSVKDFAYYVDADDSNISISFEGIKEFENYIEGKLATHQKELFAKVREMIEDKLSCRYSFKLFEGTCEKCGANRNVQFFDAGFNSAIDQILNQLNTLEKDSLEK